MVLTPRRVPLASLAAVVGGEVRGDGATIVTDVVLDSREVTAGSLFCCVPGARADGHDFAAAALAAGASALLVERFLAVDAPQLRVAAVRPVLPALADAFFGHPSRRLDLVGVTGTNGKTTTTYMLEAIAAAAGLVPGVIGTVEVRLGAERRPAVHTTPEAPDLQRLLADMAGAGVRLAAMEVSSHGLALGRVDATRFRAAIFTNLTQDHLDFHQGMEDYFKAKARLFTPAFTELGVVNVDDPYGARLAASAPVEVVTVGTGPDACWRAGDIDATLDGTRFVVSGPGPGRAVEVRLALAGRFNAVNALGALAAAVRLGIDLETAVAGLAALRRVPGRFERVDEGQPFTVLVDYSHTPDSLDNALRAARSVAQAAKAPGGGPHAPAGQGPLGAEPGGGRDAARRDAARPGGRVLVVFGCGGDRDRAKRPVMGEIAGKLADFTIVTSDNPRSEDPEAIIAEIVEGTRRAADPAAWVAEPDRRAAIARALRLARPGDVVLIAGKGHEQGQEFAGGRKVPFDDRAVAREELAELARGRAGGGRQHGGGVAP